jgi:peptidoglycan-N-acetylglucosamine deacetylase
MIFEDPSKKRWKVTLRLFIFIAIIASILLTLTIYSFIVNSPIPTLSKINQEKGRAVSRLLKQAESNGTSGYNSSFRKHSVNLTKKEIQEIKKEQKEKSLPAFSTNTYVCTAFVTQEDPESINDMKRHIKKLDVIFPDWLSFTGQKSEIDENIDSNLLDYLKSSKSLVFPRISDSDAIGNWHGQEFSQYISNAENRHNLSVMISDTLNKYNLKGINLDFEAIDQNAGNNYLELMIELREILHKSNKYLTVDVPINDNAFDYEAIGKIADSVVIMAYDEHYSNGASGPIASQGWFSNSVDDVLKTIPKEKAIVAMGQYAYDWNISKKTPAKSMSFDETMLLAGEVGADVQTEINSKNCYFLYKDNNGDEHVVWLLDAVSLWNQMQVLESENVYGVSLWRLGLEDPTIWGFYTLDSLKGHDPRQLEKVRTLKSVNFEGEGGIFRISDVPHPGSRLLTFDGGIIDSADYDKLPTSYDVQKFGKAGKMDIALTFDDGPDPVYTDQILDVLKKYGVKATFFVVGDQLQRNPSIAGREIKEGHLIGNHTYTHPNMAKIPLTSIQLELNSVQRLIEALSNKQTLLFRPPYSTDSNPTKAEDLVPLSEAAKMGYIIVGSDIDSMDYERPGVNKIVENVIGQLKDSESNIIVMHDAGGNRAQTVAALKVLIPELKSMGYRFVNVNDLLGVPAISLMPNIDLKEQAVVWADKIWTFIYSKGWAFIVILFLISTLISVLRIFFLGFFVLRSQRQKKKIEDIVGFEPFVTVIIPAYNEGKVIGKTISCLLNSSYKNFEVLIVDDGSTDNTVEEVKKLIPEDGRIRLVLKENGGKSSALNLGFKEASAEFIVTIDADTMVLPDTMANLIAPFADDKVDAVCGNIQVGNNKKILTGFQTVEYITTQNYDRRAFDELNCISVVPGATGAWKKEKVIQVGGYSDHTLTEDADLTLNMLESGAKIVYAPLAKSVTEAPETVISLFKQRFRWSYGTFQCLWKHKKSFFKGNLGWVALPNMFIFQIVFPILSPIGDLVMLLSIFRGDLKAILSGYLLFLAMDLAGSLMAFNIEKTPKKYLLYVLIQRFFYRQFMYFVTFKSIFAAIKGRRHGWNKLNRTNTAFINQKSRA